MSGVKCRGLTPDLRLKLSGWRLGEAGGISGVAVKCVEITRNTDCEGRLLGLILTLRCESVGIKQD